MSDAWQLSYNSLTLLSKEYKGALAFTSSSCSQTYEGRTGSFGSSVSGLPLQVTVHAADLWRCEGFVGTVKGQRMS